MKRVLVVPNQFKDKQFKTTIKVLDWLTEHHIEAFFPSELKDRKDLNSYSFIDDKDLDTIDYCVVLGGDGTIISSSRRYFDFEIPMIGINLGNLGFLAEIELNDLELALDDLLKGNFVVEQRMLITASDDKTDFLGHALNDVVISRQSISRMINFDVFVNDAYVNSYRADGVIISTPTGSTAYNLSAGGPIISPNNNAIVMTPICPHSLTARSIVLSGDDEVRITFKHPRNSHVNDLLVTIDGQETTRIFKEDSIRIRRAPKNVHLVRLKKNEFFEILRRKL